MTTAHSHRVAITARYHGPTNTRGGRIRIHRADSTYNDDPDRLTVSWDHALGMDDNYRYAVAEYLDRKRDAGNDWTNGGTWQLGHTANGVVAVFISPAA